VIVDNKLVYEKDNWELAWGAQDHFLECGLQVIPFTSQEDLSYVFKLDFHKWHKKWQARYANLEFHPIADAIHEDI